VYAYNQSTLAEARRGVREEGKGSRMREQLLGITDNMVPAEEKEE
jgi:hypothetical protein